MLDSPIWFWIALYWMVMYAIFLGWYARQVATGQKARMHWLVAVFAFLWIGFSPLIILRMAVTKTKR